jgi:hypothetical protein
VLEGCDALPDTLVAGASVVAGGDVVPKAFEDIIMIAVELVVKVAVVGVDRVALTESVGRNGSHSAGILRADWLLWRHASMKAFMNPVTMSRYRGSFRACLSHLYVLLCPCTLDKRSESQSTC